MGSALAGVFLNGGHPTTIWNRSSQKADPFVRTGAARAATIAEAVSVSTVVVLCVSDYGAVREFLDRTGNALPGRVVINLTSGTLEQACVTARWTLERRADYPDGAIMAVPPMIGQPDALVFYGGAEAVFGGPTSQRSTSCLFSAPRRSR